MCENSENLELNPQVHITNSPEQSDNYELLNRLLKETDLNPQLLETKGFTNVKKLGKGGFGAVYLACHQSTGEEVAIKIILDNVAEQDKDKKRFQREMQNIKFLEHPNLVKMREPDLWEDNFFIMEYCNGGSVADLLNKSDRKLPLERALEITFQALDGLEYLHNIELPEVELSKETTKTVKGLVHRDIKPANILLSKVNDVERVKIADYGLAKAFDLVGLSHITSSKKPEDKILILGTLPFMPMQQIFDSKYVEPEVDIWAMAASFYQMLTGTTPRDFSKNLDPWEVASTTQPTPIRDRNDSIPEEVAEVIDCALKDESDLYFKTAAQFKQALSHKLCI